MNPKIVRRHVPNAMIVADRFDAIRLVGQCLMEARKPLEPIGRKHRGLVSLMRGLPELPRLPLARESAVRLTIPSFTRCGLPPQSQSIT